MPEINTVHHDIALTNVSIAYRNGAYISQLISPEVAVRKQSNKYFVYDSARDRFRSDSDDRAPGTEANEVTFDLSSEAYFASDHALESVIPDEERDNADAPLQVETDRVEFLTDKILLNQEIAVAGLLRDATKIPNTTVTLAAERWSNENVDPLDLVNVARDAIVAGTQQMPNTLVLPYPVYQKVRTNPNIMSRVVYSRLGVFGPTELAQLFDVERVLIPRAVRNTAAQGQPPVMAPIWGKDALLLHVPNRVGLKSLSPAITFVWNQGGGINGTVVQSWREENRKSSMVRVQKYYDVKLVAAPAAYLMKDVIL